MTEYCTTAFIKHRGFYVVELLYQFTAMYEFFSKKIKKAFFALGLDIRRIPRESRRFVWLKNLHIKTVFDIGAHVGEFAVMIHKIFPEASIYSFEPLKECYDQLVNNMKGVSQFKAFHFALGDKDAETVIHRCKYSGSSSLLPMTELHKQAFPYTRRETVEKTQVKRLDEATRNLELCDNVLIKIDVQGFEDKVILGGQKLISRAKVLIVETSFETLYAGQPLFDEIHDILKHIGFSYKGNLNQLLNPIDGKVLQADSIFLNTS